MAKICIDAGHGGKDPGATNGHDYEKTLALQISLKLSENLKKQGFSTVLTRNNDTYPELLERCNIANKNNCDLFISIHLNSGNATANGIETLVYANTGDNHKIATYIQDELIKATASRNRGIKERKDLCVLNSTKMTAVLIEVGFISSPTELASLKNESYQNKIVMAITKAVCKYFNKAYLEGEKMAEKRYNSISEIPESLRPEIKELIDCGALRGNNNGLDLSYDMARILVIIKRYCDLKSKK